MTKPITPLESSFEKLTIGEVAAGAKNPDGTLQLSYTKEELDAMREAQDAAADASVLLPLATALGEGA
mgnify:CR=1 FL=1